MTVGVLGGGQLGRMLALAGYPLGLRFRFLDPAPDAPAGEVGDLVVGAYDDPDALERFGEGLTAVTYDFENVPAAAARFLAERTRVYPPPGALEVAQDRVAEKSLFARLGLATPAFAPVDSETDLHGALARIGLPAVLKTRRGGYDGKGQFVIRDAAELADAWEAVGGAASILEAFVPFDRELSMLAVRGHGAGDATRVVVYPLVENVHRGGILRVSRAPAPGVTPHLQEQADAAAGRILEALDYTGVLAVEMFQRREPDGTVRLLMNEFAPRVHNSGHWTIEGARTSQFENHLRAVLGLPLGDPSPVGWSVMLNLIGIIPEIGAALATPDVHVHLYGKAPRPGRKVGHITVRGRTAAEAEATAARLCADLSLG